MGGVFNYVCNVCMYLLEHTMIGFLIQMIPALQVAMVIYYRCSCTAI